MASRLGRIIKGVFVTTGNPDTVNDAPVTNTTVGSAYSLKGQLGAVLPAADGQREYIYVQFSSTSTGKTPAANDVLYWVDRANGTWVVDNNTSANALGSAVSGYGVHEVAGILRNACTRGNYVWALRKGNSIPVNSTSTGMVSGDFVVPSTSSGAATFIASTSTVVGFPGGLYIGVVASTATSSVAITTDVDIE